MVQYTQLDQEDELIRALDKSLKDKSWPNKGEIELKNVTMRYREGIEPSIKDLSFKVQAGMKVGIVGRTGSGKSSILQALFRLCDLSEGTIKIDGVDIKDVGLHELRQNIAFIPQSPFLLQGTIRENLDPFEELTTQEVQQILVDLKMDKKIS
jgi:ABC-type multidrug transport system fused ATPase/permease subunit